MVNKQLWILLFIPILLLSMIQVTLGSELNFSVSAIIPENQNDKNQTYFDLHMEPDQEQTLEVTMRNETKEDIIVEVSVNTAMTNNNGVIDYSQSEFVHDPTLEIAMGDIVEYEKEVTIEAESTLTYPIHVQMPDEQLAGILLGGIHFQEKAAGDEADNQSAQIKNKFAYVIGLKMSMDESKIKPSLELNKVKPTQINYRNAVVANIQNTEPTIVSSLKISAEVYKENEEQPILSTERDGLRMAPQSNFDYAINWENQAFEAGEYRLELSAKSDDLGWEWTEYFTIKSEDAKSLNASAVELEKDYTTFYIIGGILLLIILLGTFYWLGTRRKRKAE